MRNIKKTIGNFLRNSQSMLNLDLRSWQTQITSN